MAQNSALSTLKDLAEKEVDDAALQLGAMRRGCQQAEEQLKMLIDYQHEYRTNLNTDMTQGIGSQRWINYQQFIQTLEKAIDQHRQQHEGQRQKECGQHDVAGRRRVFGFHLFPPVTAPQKNKKRGLPVGLQANGRPLHGVCFKNAAAENSVRRASARRPGFLPEIVKIIAECRRICQDSPGQAAN